MSKTNKELRPQELKQPRKINLSSYLRDIALAILLAGSVGLISGWFIHDTIQAEAARSVLTNVELGIKTVKAVQR